MHAVPATLSSISVWGSRVVVVCMHACMVKISCVHVPPCIVLRCPPLHVAASIRRVSHAILCMHTGIHSFGPPATPVTPLFPRPPHVAPLHPVSAASPFGSER